VDLGQDPVVLAVDAHAAVPGQQPPAQCAIRLEAQDEHLAATASQVLLQVVGDAPTGAQSNSSSMLCLQPVGFD